MCYVLDDYEVESDKLLSYKLESMVDVKVGQSVKDHIGIIEGYRKMEECSMNKRFNMKHMVAAFLCGSLFLSGIAIAKSDSINVYKTVQMGEVEIPLKDAAGTVIGHVNLSQGDKGVNIHVEASKLTPGKHGFHLHEKAIEGNDFKTAGGHYNPTGKKHGFHNPDGHHAGDLQNLEVKADGTVKGDFVLEGVTLKQGKNASIWGKSLIIHADEDDGITDPSGNSGDRIAGGSILE
ncbi:superoxide dismutase family protein [Cohnella sp.]|uniref:superoxide dismutase family protein n=1 Tax=Cohnella sp. TaxID=1883426 RepID=UPI0035636499